MTLPTKYTQGHTDGYEAMWVSMLSTKREEGDTLPEFFKRAEDTIRRHVGPTREYLQGFEDGIDAAASANTKPLTG